MTPKSGACAGDALLLRPADFAALQDIHRVQAPIESHKRDAQPRSQRSVFRVTTRPVTKGYWLFRKR